jgi:glycosyltransferase involved in cell wall biosynthesis
LAKRRGITVTGWVPDARPYLDRAEIFVAPLRMGRGVQNKLLEALAMGLPCVASTAARRGTVVADGNGMLATDEPMEFARHVAGLLQDGSRRAEMSRRARAAAEAKYRWDLQLAGFDQVIATVVSQFHSVDSLLGMRPLDNDAAGESTETG